MYTYTTNYRFTIDVAEVHLAVHVVLQWMVSMYWPIHCTVGMKRQGLSLSCSSSLRWW